jgi:hypothetical protein
MIEQEFRILDVLSKEIGSHMSIRQLVGKIQAAYKTGDYKNIYELIKEMEKKKTIVLEHAGKSSIIKLNFENYLIIDLLAEMEIRKKQDFLGEKEEMQMLMMETDILMHNMPFIKSVSLIDPERNARLNKAEVMFHLKSSTRSLLETKNEINNIMTALQRMHNIKVDHLVLGEEVFLECLRSNEGNPIREMLSNKIVVLYPQSFWISIRGEILRGTNVIAEEDKIIPAKITEDDLVFNLARFGYTEFGPKIKQGKSICIEYIVSAIMLRNDARRINAIPVILAKNPKKTSYDLLLFLARRYGFEGKMLGILKALRNLVVHGMANIDESITLLEAAKTKEVKANHKAIRENLRTYNVI